MKVYVCDICGQQLMTAPYRYMVEKNQVQTIFKSPCSDIVDYKGDKFRVVEVCNPCHQKFITLLKKELHYGLTQSTI